MYMVLMEVFCYVIAVSDYAGLCCCSFLTKIFVGNIRTGTTSEQLREVFERHGEVSESDVVGGYGFVVSELFVIWLNLLTVCCHSYIYGEKIIQRVKTRLNV